VSYQCGYVPDQAIFVSPCNRNADDGSSVLEIERASLLP